jgi:hypothetical protein
MGVGKRLGRLWRGLDPASQSRSPVLGWHYADMESVTRNDVYRQLRILIDPAPAGGQVALAVVARTSRRGDHSDRLLMRRLVTSDLETDTVSSILRACSQVLLDAARELDRPSA